MILLTFAVLYNPKQIKVEILTWHVDCFPYCYLIIACKNEQWMCSLPFNYIVHSVEMLTIEVICRFHCYDSVIVCSIIKVGLRFYYPISKQRV